MTEFDPSKPVMTRDGQQARIMSKEMRNREGQTILAIIDIAGQDFSYSFYASGRRMKEHETGLDLVNIPESKWMNLYEDPIRSGIASTWQDSKEKADAIAEKRAQDSGGRRVAIVEWKAKMEFITTAVEK